MGSLRMLIACAVIAAAVPLTGARRRGRSKATSTDQAATGLAVVPDEVIVARDLIDKKQFDEAERHIGSQLPIAIERRLPGVDELQLLHGLALFELTRWGEAVLALRRAKSGGSNQAIVTRAQGYLKIARQAMTHTMFDTIAHRTLQHACCARTRCVFLCVLNWLCVHRRMPARVRGATYLWGRVST